VWFAPPSRMLGAMIWPRQSVHLQTESPLSRRPTIGYPAIGAENHAIGQLDAAGLPVVGLHAGG
jgi:hypothetical protein